MLSPALPDGLKDEVESLDYPAGERRLNGYDVECLPIDADKTRVHQHAGGEFIYMPSGTLTVRIGSEEHTLEARGWTGQPALRPTAIN
jgi:hypothetical protein